MKTIPVSDPEGRKRVIISNVKPAVEGGRFPAKATINEEFTVSADIFCDGHDLINAALYFKGKRERSWKYLPMKFLHNDYWQADLKFDKPGLYQFQVRAWIDHFGSWEKGFRKKKEAGQDIQTELKIAASLVEKTARRAPLKEQSQLLRITSILAEGDLEDTLSQIGNPRLTALMYQYRDQKLDSFSEPLLEVEVERKKASFSAWYEMFPRSASSDPGRHGTFNDVVGLIPRIASMGFDTLYFPPIHPIGHNKRKGKNNSLSAKPGEPGSPWAIGNSDGGHKSVNPELGNLEDFRNLVNTASESGIEIALDLAYQCSNDHPYVKDCPQWFNWRPDGTVQHAENPPKVYEDIIPFNFECDDWQNLWRELKNVVDFWIGQGVKIFRVDNPHTKAIPFWRWMIPEVRKKNPDVIFLAEAFTRPRIMEYLGKIGFSQSYTYFTWRNQKWELEEYVRELTTKTRYHLRPNFWPNTPDILHEFLVQGGENAHLLRVVLAATLSSSYGIYGPVYEFGINDPYPGKEEYMDNEKYEIRYWDWSKTTRISETITRLNKIRKDNPALQNSWNTEFIHCSNEKLIGFVKIDHASANRFIIIVTLDPHNTQAAMVHVPLKKLGLPLHGTYTVNDLLNNETYTWKDDENYVELNPHNKVAHLFKVDL